MLWSSTSVCMRVLYLLCPVYIVKYARSEVRHTQCPNKYHNRAGSMICAACSPPFPFLSFLLYLGACKVIFALAKSVILLLFPCSYIVVIVYPLLLLLLLLLFFSFLFLCVVLPPARAMLLLYYSTGLRVEPLFICKAFFFFSGSCMVLLLIIVNNLLLLLLLFIRSFCFYFSGVLNGKFSLPIIMNSTQQ